MQKTRHCRLCQGTPKEILKCAHRWPRPWWRWLQLQPSCGSPQWDSHWNQPRPIPHQSIMDTEYIHRQNITIAILYRWHFNSPSNTDRVTSNTRDSATSPIVIHHVQLNARTRPQLGRAQQQPATQARAGGALQMPSHTTQPTNIDNNVSQNYSGYTSAQRPATQGPAGQTSNRATATQAPSDPTQAPSADEQRSSTPREDVENQW